MVLLLMPGELPIEPLLDEPLGAEAMLPLEPAEPLPLMPVALLPLGLLLGLVELEPLMPAEALPVVPELPLIEEPEPEPDAAVFSRG